MSSDEFVTAAFGATNLLRLAGYLPQIWCVARDRTGAPAISCLGWSLWTAANATTALYAWTHWRDLPLTLINGGNAIGCGCVIVLVLAHRARLRRQAAAAARGPLGNPPASCSTASRSVVRL